MKRFPDKQEIINSFLTILAVVNFWSMIVFLYNVPGLIKQLALSEVLSVLSYVLFSALFESLVIFLILVGLSFLLPATLLRNDFSVRSILIILLTTIYIIPFHISIPRISSLIFETGVTVFIAIWTLLYIIELFLFHRIIPRYPNFTAKIKTFIDKIVVLGGIYLFFNLIALGAVLIGNWS